MQRIATYSIIHIKTGLDLRSILELYMEEHATSHARNRLKGDSVVNHVIDTTLEKGRQLHKEKVQISFIDILHMNTVQGQYPCFTGDRAQHLQNTFSCKVQEQVRNWVRFDTQEKWEEHVRSITV